MTDQSASGMSGEGVTGPAGAPPAAQGYRVLARKYRPSSFADLIGQDAMVRTISNAFETGRIPQAWILTGVRGVGKTTTARILARALNYELADGSVTAPTIAMPVLGVHCQAIMESRHLDVLEMDAASHTGVDDVRQITDGVNYAPTSARYKVYIIDEVHMLSEKAFNAFLKTLEEPPAHAKFIFATTEIRKVPITVLSRCQRFDLRRVEADVLVKNLERIAREEKVEADDEALRLIARAAEGSVRDSLSLFDQAIAHAAGTVRTDDVRQMLGLADRARVIDLFAALAAGDIETAFREFRDQYDTGADPVVVLSDLAEFVNFVTRVKIVPAAAESHALSETERLKGRDFAAKLSMRVLSRMWQMLLKGITEVKEATRPVAAAEMVLVRIAYAADLPTPDEAVRSLTGNGEAANSTAPAASARPMASRSETAPVSTFASAHSRASGNPGATAATDFATPSSPLARGRTAQDGGTLRQQAAVVSPVLQENTPALRLSSFPELVALAAERRDLPIKAALENDVRLVRMEDGRLEIALEGSAQRSLVQDLSRKLEQWTGRRWTVAVSNAEGQPTLRSQALAQKSALEEAVQQDPRVQAVLQRWPGAKIETVRRMARPHNESDLSADTFGEDD